MRGALFENHVINEIVKYDLNRNRNAQLYFFRDSNGNEVDLLYGRGPKLVPIEIKSGQTIGSDWFKGIDHFARHFPATRGAVIYAGETTRHRSDGRAVLPADELPTLLEAITWCLRNNGALRSWVCSSPVSTCARTFWNHA